ncbi:MAG: nitroreductase family protein [Candidatus Bathyarchaeia archaeon]
MDVLEAVKTRRSIRKYDPKPVEEEKLTNILEAARLSPTAANRQPVEIIVVKDQATKQRLIQAYKREWFTNAPIILATCANPQKAWKRADGEEYWKVDAAIAMQTMVLVATAQGLGTCWIAGFDEKKAKEILGIPENIRVVSLTPLGYPAETKTQVEERKPLEQLIHHDHW